MDPKLSLHESGNNYAPITEFVDDFRGQYRFLSNFHPSYMQMWGIEFPTAEHAYQAAKTLDKARRRGISMLPSPSQAKRAGRQLVLREDWSTIRIAVMYEVVAEKFKQNPALAERLLKTEGAYLSEGNTWGDNFWGHDAQKKSGQNWLGRILMLVRSQLTWGSL